jgi:hypothetical protein
MQPLPSSPTLPGATPERAVNAPLASLPDWVADIRRKYTLRGRDWLCQSWALLRAPHLFMQEWSEGRREALNPLRFFAFGTMLTLLMDRGGRALLHKVAFPSNDIRDAVRTSGGLVATVVVIAACMHLVLRTRSRIPFRGSLAATAYAFAGPGVFCHLFGWIVSAAIYFTHGTITVGQGGWLVGGGSNWPWPIGIMTLLSFLWTVVAVAGVHRLRWWWGVIALVGTSLIFTIMIGLAGYLR